MSTQLIIRLEKELKDQASQLAKRQGKNLSLVVRDLLADYVKTHDQTAYINQLWSEIGNEMKRSGMRPENIDVAIHAVRNDS
ncbi:MAG: CopG family transcriptional regulator [Candidatus Marinimicrobia bacterium]|nr:CopG family transcriptional regulator [Candidatus Neomarinimicrobiota bacterium]